MIAQRKQQTIINKDMTFTEAFNRYIRARETKAGLSTETLKTYKIHISKLLERLNCDDVLCSKMDQEDYISFVSQLQSEDIKSVTVASYCRSVKAFLNYCFNKKLTNMFKVTISKADTSTKKYIPMKKRLLQERDNLT